MKSSLLLLVMLTSAGAIAGDYRPLETVDQARQRQSAENYDTYRRQDNTLLPPSYSRPLGDTEQRGVERPGYAAPAPVYQPAPTTSYQQPSSGGDWRRGLR